MFAQTKCCIAIISRFTLIAVVYTWFSFVCINYKYMAFETSSLIYHTFIFRISVAFFTNEIHISIQRNKLDKINHALCDVWIQCDVNWMERIKWESKNKSHWNLWNEEERRKKSHYFISIEWILKVAIWNEDIQDIFAQLEKMTSEFYVRRERKREEEKSSHSTKCIL